MAAKTRALDPPRVELPETIAEIRAAMADRDWRLRYLYWIKDKDGKKVRFRPNPAQMRLLDTESNRNVVLKARQMGFTTLIQIDMLDTCLFTPHTSAGVIAHNLDDAVAFFRDKIKFAYDNLPQFLRDQITADTDSARELRFSNGSVIRVGTSLRSGTLQLLHVSEYGKLCARNPERAREVKTGSLPTVPTGGRIWIESTAEGRMGDFFDICETAKNAADGGREVGDLGYAFHFFPWHNDDGYRLDVKPYGIHQYTAYFDELAVRGIEVDEQQRWWYVATAQNLGQDMKREYPSFPEEAFESAIIGSYFQRQMAQVRANGQITRVPIEPRIPIQTFWDLGRDTTSIWFFQAVGFEYRFIDYYQNSGEWMAHYLQVLADRRNGGEKYLYGDMYLPHDGSRKSVASDDSPADILYRNGYDVRIVPRTQSKDISIERLRHALPLCYFDADRCADGIKCLDGYRKEWNDKLGTWGMKPLHNEASHGADAAITWADGWHHERDIEENTHGRVLQRGRGRNRTTGY